MLFLVDILLIISFFHLRYFSYGKESDQGKEGETQEEEKEEEGEVFSYWKTSR